MAWCLLSADVEVSLNILLSLQKASSHCALPNPNLELCDEDVDPSEGEEW